MNTFKVTNIDNIEIGKTDGVQNEEGQVQDQIQGQVEAQKEEVLTNETPQQQAEQGTVVNETQTAETEVSGENQAGQEKNEKQVDQPLFETSSVDFDEPVVDTIEHDEPVADTGVTLASLFDEHQDLLKEYASANKDYSTFEDLQLIEAHLKDAHPDLSQDDIEILLNDYKYDEDTDDKADIVKKKIAKDLATKQALSHLNTKKENLLNELGQRTLSSPAQQDVQAQLEAQARAEAAQKDFMDKTDQVFTDFKGFEFKMSDSKKLNVKINNVDAVKSQQSDINNFIGRYFDLDNGSAKDLAGYHKALFVAMNHEQMLQNAYNQGKADAITAEQHQAKNIDMNARTQHKASPNKKVTWRHVD